MSTSHRILIVDDEEVVRCCHRRVLAGSHNDVVAVCSGADALQAMEAAAYDVVLLDLRMPGMDGMTVLREICRRWPECEVIVITGYPSLDTAKEAIRVGARDYLSKPLEPTAVIEAAAQAIEHKHWTLRCDSPSRRAFASPQVQSPISAN